MLKLNNYTPELKLTFTILLIFFSIITLYQFLPTTHHLPFPTSCTTTSTPSTTTTPTTTPPPPPPPPPPQQPTDQILPNGVIKRSFYPIGTAAYTFIFMSAYRGGPNTFAIMGLSSTPLFQFGHPTFTCEYQTTNNNNNENKKVNVTGQNLISQDYRYPRVYLILVINCTFPPGTTDDPTTGGRLLLHTSTNGGYDTAVNETDTIIAITEPQNSWDPSNFTSPPKYKYLYCGGTLFGDLSPQRVREWIAYHARLFGNGSHFVIHNAGGVHNEVMEVLKPWIELGYVSLEDLREEGRFDSFYHNQMIALNDCLHKYRFDTKWMFFFDVDEYIYLGDNGVIDNVMESLKDYTQVIMHQVSMSHQLCLARDSPSFSEKWGFEKLVYKNAQNQARDIKYAIQPRNVYATGVHMTKNLDGESTELPDNLMKYFHYHGTVAKRREPCEQLIEDESVTMKGTPYVLDTTLTSLGPLVKQFELDTIGSGLQSTSV